MVFQLHLDTERVGQMEFPPALCVEPHDDAAGGPGAPASLSDAGVSWSVDEGQLIGIYTERDALRLMAGGAELDTPIEQRMSAPVGVHLDRRHR